jgi:hypothetical protein
MGLPGAIDGCLQLAWRSMTFSGGCLRPLAEHLLRLYEQDGDAAVAAAGWTLRDDGWGAIKSLRRNHRRPGSLFHISQNQN